MANDKDLCVSVQGVSKKFARSLKRSFIYGAQDLGRAILQRQGDTRLRKSEFWAVRDVSFELERGQSIGIIGLNGSGKTTLMRMVSGIFRPTLGRISVNGRIAPMLALGAGFKPVLSGRENVFLNLSLLGVPQKDIRARFDSIVDFAELWEAIDAPLGTYSSGMLARLGFACAVHTNPQILVVDEVLSVGDTRFRMKCRNHINELRKAGTSMLLVSHSSILIETLSDQCLYLQNGKVAALGNPSEVLKSYEVDTIKLSAASNAAKTASLAQRAATEEGQAIVMREVHFLAPGTSDAGYWLTGRAGELVISINCARTLDDLSINLMIFDLTHQPGETALFMMSSRDIGWLRLHQKDRDQEIRLTLPAVGLRPGSYRVKVSISQGEIHDLIDVIDNIKLVVRDTGFAANSLYFQPRDWHVDGGEITRPATLPDTDCLENAEDF